MSINERKDKTGTIKEVDLGLSDSETQALNECRRLVADNADLDDFRDATLARFLRNQSWAVEPAIKQMKEYLAWRKENNIDTILDAGIPNHDMIRTLVPYAYHNFDKGGRPIYIEKTGMVATAALNDDKINEPVAFMRSHIYGLELLQRRMNEQSLLRKERVNGICTILDFAGLGFHHRQCIGVLKKCMDFDTQYYPEYLDKLYVINTPWVTPYLFQGVQVFLSEVLKSRIQVVSGDPSAFLLEHIDACNLPAEYGGSCTGEACQHGGMGADYARVKGCVDVLDSSNLAAADVSGLDCTEVKYDFEKLVSASDSGANETFTWYFEVADGYDIDFSIEMLPVSGVKEVDENKRVLVQKVERLKSGKGTFQAPFPNAKLLFRWDNNFSYFASKNLKYTVSCIHDDSGKLDSILSASKK